MGVFLMPQFIGRCRLSTTVWQAHKSPKLLKSLASHEKAICFVNLSRVILKEGF